MAYSNKELIEQIKAERRKVAERIRRIEARPELPQYAVERFREVEQGIPNRYAKLDEKQLRELHRELRYINAMKTSRIEGAEKALEEFEPIHDLIKTLSENKQADIWRAYEKLFNEAPTIDKFKYDVLSVITDLTFMGVSGDDIHRNIMKLYDEAYRMEEKGNTNGAKVLFTQGLQTLRK